MTYGMILVGLSKGCYNLWKRQNSVFGNVGLSLITWYMMHLEHVWSYAISSDQFMDVTSLRLSDQHH